MLSEQDMAEAYARGRNLTVDEAIALALHQDDAPAD